LTLQFCGYFITRDRWGLTMNRLIWKWHFSGYDLKANWSKSKFVLLNIHVKYNVNFFFGQNFIFRKQYNLHAMKFLPLRKILTLRVKHFVQWNCCFYRRSKRKFVEISMFGIAGILIVMVRVFTLPFTYSLAFLWGYFNESSRICVPWQNIWLEKGIEFLRGVFHQKVRLGSNKILLFVTPLLNKSDHERVSLRAVCFTHHLCTM